MDLLNELQYQFGTKSALEGTARKDQGTGKIEPTLLQRMLGVNTQMMETAADQGKFNRFGDTQQGQDARRYGVEVTRADMDNLGGLQDRIDTAKSLRTNREVLTGLGYTGDTSKYSTLGSLAGAIRNQKDLNESERVTKTQNQAYYSPTAIDERKVRDRRYYDSKAENAQLRLDTLEAQARSERREDKRYNERLLMEQKKDRRAAMQNLAAGLASLGAAFAL